MKSLKLTLFALLVSFASFAQIAAITGPPNICSGSTVTYSDATTGGTWSSSSSGVATIGSSSGVATGVALGPVTITYTVGSSYVTYPITVNPVPASISGSMMVCVGSAITLSDPTTGGVWSSSNPVVGSISAVGVVTGVSAGTTTITYAVSTGCAVTLTVTVNPGPLPITGPSTVCSGSSITLSDGIGGGIWSSSNVVIATVGSASGVVTGGVSGTAVITYVIATGCSVSKTVTVSAASPLHNVTGGGMYCAGGTGVVVGLDGSDAGISYQLYVSGVAIGSPIMGTGAALTFGLQTSPGVYTVIASGSCATTMSGSAVITVNPLPAAYTITGGGGYCTGGPGMHIGLSGSVTGVDYQLLVSGVPVGAPLLGTGAPLDFGTFTTAGTYTVAATNTSTSCVNMMVGSVIITVSPLPTAYAVTGGGSYCAGGTGVAIGLASSDLGISYQLYVGGTPVGTTIPGTGLAISFGMQTVAGTYTVVGADVATGCTNNMTGTVTVAIDPLPTAYAITGGGSYCAGGAGVAIGLANSNLGVSYQLFNGTTMVGTAMSGTGAAISFGLLTAAGTYTIVATNSTTSCTNSMTGSVTVAITALPTVTATVSTATCGSLVTLTAGGAVSYSWAPSTGLSCTACGTATTTPSASITYTVIGTDGSGCTNTATASVDGNNISGHITYSGGVSTDVFKVWLIQFNPADSSITSTDSTNSCMDSGIPYFAFADPAPGNYLVKAKLDGTIPGTSGYIPTYSSSTPYWYLGASDAHTTSADLMDITMVYGTVPPGPGFISGFVYAGAGRGTSGDSPEPGMLIYLKNTSGAIVTYTYTDVTGAYTFSGIANGSYIIYPETFKYYTTPSAVINLTPSNEIINSVDFKKHTTFGTITPNTTSILSVANNAELNYYPNPTTGILNVANNALLTLGSNAGQTASVVVTDITGNVVYKTNININPAQKYSQVDLTGLTNGVYLINYSNNDIHFSGKVLIMK